MKTKILFICLICLILGAQRAVPQVYNLEQQYVPVTAATAEQPLFELNVNEWTAFRFDQTTKAWSAIPFQFDQLTDTKRYDRDSDDITDATDEITFLPTDAGDRAALSDWIDDESARGSERIQITLTDPLDPTKQGWIYLFKNVTTAHSTQSYLNYMPGPAGTPAADTIKTASFKLGHNKNGWIDYLTLGHSFENLIDRFKLRLKGDGFLIPPYDINEDYVEASTAADAVSYYPGPVRSFHITKADILLEKLNIPLIPKRSSFEYNYEYTPYSFEIEAETAIDASLLVIFGVQLIRQSLDFSPHAAGMMFYSKSNPDGVLIDGVVTDYSDVLDQSERQNWVMASGETGTVFLMFDINLMKNSKRRIYFRDQKENPWTGDETGNTGDQYSYGDMGVMIEATGDALITDKLTISYKGYFLDKTNANVEFGKQLLSWEQNPIDVSASTQYYEPATLVEEPGSRPDDFKLHAAYPNPFSMTSDQSVRFEFSGQVNELYNLVVYNAIGQQVAEFKNLTVNSNGRHSLLWDAHDNVGMPLMTGVYFYKLQNGAKIQTGKLVVSR